MSIFSRRKPQSRRAHRFPAPRVLLRTPRLEAEVIDLSTLGAAIETTASPPRIGAQLLCELEDERTAALIPGEVRWCRLGGTTNGPQGDVVPVYRAGIRFTNDSPRNLLRILRSLGLHRPAGTG